MSAAEKLIHIAKEEVGYLEKKSMKDLDHKTANAGTNNYTKYDPTGVSPAWAITGRSWTPWA